MSTSSPLTFSIITATLNRANVLKNAIQSVAQQAYPNIEYIIVDGNSQDETDAVVQNYQQYIHRCISEPDGGIYDAFNKGVEIATGDIIYFLNSDDILYDAKVISDVAKIFEDHPDIEIVYGDVLVTDYNQYYRVLGKSLTLQDLKEGQCCYHPAFFVKKQLFEKYGPFDLSLKVASDYDFMLRCLLKNNLTKSFYLHRTINSFHTGGISSDPKYEAIILHERQLILKKYFKVETDSHLLLKKFYSTWLQQILSSKQGICHPLKLQGIHSIAILGTLDAGQCLYFDAKNSGIDVVAFLDNNNNNQGKQLFNIPVISPQHLAQFQEKIDAILISIESCADIQTKNQLHQLICEKIPIFLWKELIDIEFVSNLQEEVCVY